MFNRCVFVSLVASAVVALPAALSAQAWPPPPPPAKNMDRLPPPRAQTLQPEAEGTAAPQIEQAKEPEPASPAAATKKPEKPEKPEKAEKAEKPATRHAAKNSEHTIACEGTFARTTSQLRLEYIYKAQNVAFTQVDGSGGNKVMATVLFPNDPKQRLEVWWSDEEKRRDVYLIVINGQSAWAVPHGIRLGLGLAALEKLNHKPFKLTGLDGDNSIQVSDWNGGALARLPGGCKVGVRIRAGADVAADLREAAAASKEFASSDPAIRAMKPVVTEIMLGY